MAPRLALADAQPVLEAALAKAEEIGQPMNVAVVDDGGHLIAFARQDGAILGSIDIAIRKARTAALLKMTTAQLGEAAAPGAPLYGIEVTNGGLVIFGGGIPLVRGREVVGAIGVSAGSVEQDTEVAEAGLAALPKRGRR
ncbi:GlcG/HbpS family heme-binding protein [Amycolatopsis thermoflava]|uniref:GlcG/HbpS family heme-binding protein n=1 Tax=Amycolatopsis thermoflava TaxID=84480 RepID=UPI003EBBF17E